MISLFLLYSLKRLPTWFCIILTFSQSVCVCVCCMFLCELCYADFVYLLRLSHMSKRRLTREGTNICETKGKNSVWYAGANECRCCVANKRGQCYWLTTNKSTTNLAISANSQHRCSCKCSTCLHPFSFSLHI